MNAEDVDRFEKVVGQLQSVYDELALLSKKSPNDAVNKFKIRFVNKLLGEGLELLGDKYRPFEDFSEFSEDEVPQNSDVVFMLTQYLQCFEKLRADNVVYDTGRWYWKVLDRDHPNADDKGYVRVRTVEPKRLRE